MVGVEKETVATAIEIEKIKTVQYSQERLLIQHCLIDIYKNVAMPAIKIVRSIHLWKIPRSESPKAAQAKKTQKRDVRRAKAWSKMCKSFSCCIDLIISLLWLSFKFVIGLILVIFLS